MRLKKIHQKSRNQHKQLTPICWNYQKGLAGFCIHCHKLQHQHTLIKPIINDNDWIII